MNNFINVGFSCVNLSCQIQIACISSIQNCPTGALMLLLLESVVTLLFTLVIGRSLNDTNADLPKPESKNKCYCKTWLFGNPTQSICDDPGSATFKVTCFFFMFLFFNGKSLERSFPHILSTLEY